MAGDITSLDVWRDADRRLQLRVWGLTALPPGPVGVEDLRPYRAPVDDSPIIVDPGQGVRLIGDTLYADFAVTLEHRPYGGPVLIAGLALVLPGDPDFLVGVGAVEPSAMLPGPGHSLVYGCHWYCLGPVPRE